MIDSTNTAATIPNQPALIESLHQGFQDTGSFRWVLLGVLILALAVVLERLFFYYVVCRNVSTDRAADAARAIENGQIDEKIKTLSRKKDPLSVLMKTALSAFAEKKANDEISEAIDEESVMQVPRFSQGLSYIALFANIATLLGLLGTIVGLQEAFMSLNELEGAAKTAKLTMGISKAMNTTAFGLIIAVPCMVFYTYLHNKQKGLTRTLDDAMLRLFNYMRRAER
ncbi:MAG: MotA/TolQ/ExbB proton channel family protein [Fibrobacterota bacterium]